MTADHATIQDRAWQEIADILQIEAHDPLVRSRIETARNCWEEYLDRPGDLVPSNEMRENLARVGELANELAEKLSIVRGYLPIELLSFKNGIDLESAQSQDPFSDHHISMLRKVGLLTVHAAEEIRPTPRKPVDDPPQRLAFIHAASVYEQQTGRAVTYSKDKQQNPSGPFIRYMMAFCRLCFPSNKHEVSSIVSFCEWYRSARKAGRDPLLWLVGL